MSATLPIYATEGALPDAAQISEPFAIVLNYNGSGAPATFINNNGTWQLYTPLLDPSDSDSDTAPFVGATRYDLGMEWVWETRYSASGGAWLSKQVFSKGAGYNGNVPAASSQDLKSFNGTQIGEFRGYLGMFDTAYIIGITGDWTNTPDTTLRAMQNTSDVRHSVSGTGINYKNSFESSDPQDKLLTSFRTIPLWIQVVNDDASLAVSQPVVEVHFRYKHPTW